LYKPGNRFDYDSDEYKACAIRDRPGDQIGVLQRGTAENAGAGTKSII